jgi:hypothetical protein
MFPKSAEAGTMGSQNRTNFYITIFEYWNFGRTIAIQPMERRGPELRSMGFFNISTKFLIGRIPSGIGIFGLWPDWRMSPRRRWLLVSCLTVFALRPLQRALIHPILIAGTQVILEKSRPDSQTPRPRIPNPVLFTTKYQRNYFEISAL